MVLSNTAGNPLSAGSLSLFMAASLQRGPEPQLKTPYEAVALAVHAGMIAVGFRLVGLGDEDRVDAQADAHNPQPLPPAWNASSSSSYAFRYAHSQSSMEFVIKVNRLGGKAVVFAIAVGDDKTVNFDLSVKDYLSESNLPLILPEDTSTEDAAKKIQDAFISSGRLNDLGSLLKISVIQKLAPSLNKEGYEEESRSEQQQQQQEPPPQPGRDQQQQPRRPQPPDPDQPARPYPFADDPLAIPRPQHPGRPLPEPIPGFEDEFELNRPPRPPGGGLRDDRFPAGIGHDDLYPPGLGPHDPLRPHFGGGGLGPPGGGGMHPTFDDPMFGGGGGGGGGFYDPMAPPGARVDPIGPGGVPRDSRGGRGGFPGRGGGFGGGAPPNPFGGFGSGDFI